MTRDDQRFLQALLDGELRRDDPTVAQRLAARPDLREQLADLELLRRELERGGAEQRAIQAGLAEVRDADRRTVGAALEAGARRQRFSARLRPVLALAALVACVATAAWWWGRASQDTPAVSPTFLRSNGSGEALRIEGSRTEGLNVRYTVDKPSGTYRVRIDGLHEGRPDGKVPFKSAPQRPEDVRDGTYLQWSISSEQLQALPDEVLVRVEHDDGTHVEFDSAPYSLR